MENKYSAPKDVAHMAVRNRYAHCNVDWAKQMLKICAKMHHGKLFKGNL
jgi:hypothetical protein